MNVSVAPVMQHAKSMRRVLLLSVVCPALPCVSSLSHTHFGKVIEYKMRILIFSITCFWRISRSKKNSMRYCYKCTLVFIYSTRYSYQNLVNLFNKISRNTQISNFMKIRPLSSELFHADGQTDSQT